MAETLVALSLSANILQFIDVGSRFVSTAWKIYRASRERVNEQTDIHTIIIDLKDVLEDLQRSTLKDESNNEVGFQRLVKDCRKLAGELLDALQKVNWAEKVRKRDALKAALEMIWREDEIKPLQLKLEAFRQQLILHLLNWIR